MYGCRQNWIYPRQYWLDWPEAKGQIRIQSCENGIVVTRRRIHIQMMADRVFKAFVCSVMKICCLYCCISQRRATKLVTIGRTPRDLFQSKVFILSRTVEYHISFACT